jgi:metal-responsive CopG/Arc/MetJ family transcriptional regulator
MKRTNFFLPVPLINKLKAIAKRDGISLSEVIRRALFAYLA